MNDDLIPPEDVKRKAARRKYIIRWTVDLSVVAIVVAWVLWMEGIWRF